MMNKIVGFVLLLIMLWGANMWVTNVWIPEQQKELQIRQVENNDEVAKELRSFATWRNWIDPLTVVVTVLLFLSFFSGDISRARKKSQEAVEQEVKKPQE